MINVHGDNTCLLFVQESSIKLQLPLSVLLCRAGRPGTVISLVSGGERFVVDKLARRLGISIDEVEVAQGEAREAASGGGEGRAAGGSGGSSSGAAGRRHPGQRAQRQ
jgi:hypothetical protein